MSLIQATQAAKDFFPYVTIGENVSCVSCKDEYSHWLPMMEHKMCYNNATTVLQDTVLHGLFDARYVLGVAVHYIPVDHAWVRIGDTYYDPTWEAFSELGNYYFPVYEFTAGQLHKLIEHNGMRPPALWEMKKLLTLVDL